MTVFYFSDVTNEFRVVSLSYVPSFSPFERIFQVVGFHEIVPTNGDSVCSGNLKSLLWKKSFSRKNLPFCNLGFSFHSAYVAANQSRKSGDLAHYKNDIKSVLSTF